MESVGWLDAEPALKPKPEKNSDGFDYDKNITVLEQDILEFDGGGAFEIRHCDILKLNNAPAWGSCGRTPKFDKFETVTKIYRCQPR